MDEDAYNSLNSLRLTLLQQYPLKTDISPYKPGIRNDLMAKIENIIIKITGAIARGEEPYFVTVYFGEFGNCNYNGRLKLKEFDKCKKKKISFARIKSRTSFATIIFMLSKVYKLLASNKTCTRREIYYRNFDIFKTQIEVDDAMRNVCYIVDAPSWELGVFSTVKGIVAGPLIFKSGDNVIHCDKPGGVLIPQNILHVELISTSIRWALVVEKDAVFQSILDGNGLARLNDCLLITGKGYPDTNTRLLINRLWECFRIPIFALVDADPFGFDIMSVYRFGSWSSSAFADRLACPPVRWLGIHPSDIRILASEYTNLTDKDSRRLLSILNRPYVQQNERILNELRIMLDNNIKCEIEGISTISPNYLTDVYIPSKIRCKEYI